MVRLLLEVWERFSAAVEPQPRWALAQERQQPTLAADWPLAVSEERPLPPMLGLREPWILASLVLEIRQAADCYLLPQGCLPIPLRHLWGLVWRQRRSLSTTLHTGRRTH